MSTTRTSHGIATSSSVRREPVAVGQPDVDQYRVRPELGCLGQRLGHAAGLADHRVPPTGQDSRGEASKSLVVIDDEHSASHPSHTRTLAPPAG